MDFAGGRGAPLAQPFPTSPEGPGPCEALAGGKERQVSARPYGEAFRVLTRFVSVTASARVSGDGTCLSEAGLFQWVWGTDERGKRTGRALGHGVSSS